MTISIIDNKTFIIPFELIVSAFIGLLVYLLINRFRVEKFHLGVNHGCWLSVISFFINVAIFNKQTLGLGIFN